jgi:hypothetical protein
MYEGLGLNDSVLQRMTEEINHLDRHADCPRTHFATVLKMAKVYMPGADNITYKYSIRFINAVHANLEQKPRAPRNELPLFGFAKRLIDSKSSFEDSTARESMLDMLDEESRTDRTLVFSLRSIYEALWRTNGATSFADKARAIDDEVLWLLNLIYKNQIDFHGFRATAKSQNFTGWYKIPVFTGSGTVWVDAAFAQTDNPQAHNALRSLGAVLSIIMTGKGNVTILGNHRIAGRLGILDVMDEGVCDLIAMNRYCDLPAGAEKSVTWPILRCRGNTPVDKHWYLGGSDDPKEDKWLSGYNGTWFHDVPITGIPLAKNANRMSLQQNSEMAFDPREVARWKEICRVPDSSWFNPITNLDNWLKPAGLDLNKAFRQ